MTEGSLETSDYSCSTALDLRIARDVLRLSVNADQGTCVDPVSLALIPIPCYSTDPRVAELVIQELHRDRWKIEAVVGGSIGRVGTAFGGVFRYRAAKPGHTLADAPVAQAATRSCALMSAVARAFDRN